VRPGGSEALRRRRGGLIGTIVFAGSAGPC
jgi:hypothetical protein